MPTLNKARFPSKLSKKTPRRLSIGKSREAYEGMLAVNYSVNRKNQAKLKKIQDIDILRIL